MTSKVDLEINQGSDYSVFFVIRDSADVCHKRRAEQLGGGVAAKRLLPSNRWSSFTTATWPHRLTTETI